MEQVFVGDGIIKAESTYFDLQATLLCGQLFRYYVVKENLLNIIRQFAEKDFFVKNDTTIFKVFSANKMCYVAASGDTTAILGDTKYFLKYFDLSRDYKKIVCQLNNIDNSLTKNCCGIHILNQDLSEAIISFIISANNNIPRIQATLNRLCALCGERLADGYGFPAIDKLKSLKASDYAALGCGYRSSYLEKTVKNIADNRFMDTLKKSDYKSAVKMLTGLSGIGQKVADCICLFALGHTEAYPVDTWIIKTNKAKKGEAKKVGMLCRQKYKELAGFVQQYQFYNQRLNKL